MHELPSFGRPPMQVRCGVTAVIAARADDAYIPKTHLVTSLITTMLVGAARWHAGPRSEDEKAAVPGG